MDNEGWDDMDSIDDYGSVDLDAASLDTLIEWVKAMSQALDDEIAAEALSGNELSKSN